MPAATQNIGQMEATDTSSEYNRNRFVIDQMLARARTMALVKVISVTSQGQVAKPGTVSVQPLVNMIDGTGNSQAHGTINTIPYVRLQGGANGIINDPQVGDIGLAIMADRDGSGVIKASAAANPGSRRRHDFADGVYLGAILGASPTQGLQFTQSPAGIVLFDANNNKVTMNPNGMIIKDKSNNTITLSASGTVIVDANNNSVTMKSNGIIIFDDNSNEVAMASNGIIVQDSLGDKLTLSSAGFELQDAAGNKVQMISGVLNITAAGPVNVTATTLAVTGNITASGTITANTGVSHVGLTTHTHSASGAGPPNPGT